MIPTIYIFYLCNSPILFYKIFTLLSSYLDGTTEDVELNEFNTGFSIFEGEGLNYLTWDDEFLEPFSEVLTKLTLTNLLS